MIQTKVTEKGEETRKTFYGITSVPRKYADAARVLSLKRKYWLVENRLHYRRDVTLGEDASQIRFHGVPEVIATLNGGLLALLDFFGEKQCRKANETFFVLSRKKPYNYCLASFPGNLGKPKSPGSKIIRRRQNYLSYAHF